MRSKIGLSSRQKKIRNIIIIVFLDIVMAAGIVLMIFAVNHYLPERLQSEDITVDNKASEAGTNGKTEWQIKFADHFTDKIISTDSSYSSPDISIDVSKHSYGNGNDKISYVIADIYVSKIECLKTQFANGIYGVGYEQRISSLSKSVNAIFAINGDSYSNNHNREKGTIVRNGTVYRSKKTPYDICALYYDGTMKTFAPSAFDTDQAIADGVYQTWIFGPILMDGNGKASSEFNARDYIKQRHPRSAIGYYEPGHYCMVVVDGRQKGYSKGMNLEELAAVFEKLGCKQAYNLDGGHCSFMTMYDKIVNHPYRPKKPISDCIYISEVKK